MQVVQKKDITYKYLCLKNVISQFWKQREADTVDTAEDPLYQFYRLQKFKDGPEVEGMKQENSCIPQYTSLRTPGPHTAAGSYFQAVLRPSTADMCLS